MIRLTRFHRTSRLLPALLALAALLPLLAGPLLAGSSGADDGDEVITLQYLTSTGTQPR